MAKAPDYGREVGTLEGQVGLLTKLTFAIIPLIIAMGGGLYWQINDVRSKLEERISGVGERLTKIETSVGALGDRLAKVETSENQFAYTTTATLARIEERIAAAARGQSLTPILLLSYEDGLAIRNALKDTVDPAIVFNGIGKVGDVVSGAKVAAFPENLINKYPLLKNMQYTFDLKNQLLIVDADRRIVAVV